MKKLKLTPAKDFVISKADRDICLGSAEVKPCPFCGGEALSSGIVNQDSGNYVHHVLCRGCNAHIACCMEGTKQDEARKEAIRRWNHRVGG